MDQADNIPPELAGRWQPGVVLKRDVFSTVERGRFAAQDGEQDAVLRRLDTVPWWSFPLALHLFRRERKALAAANDLDAGPKLLYGGERYLVRSFIDGVALHIAKPQGERAYFRSAIALLFRLHRARITHNDLAKEQNWLRGADGRAYVTDFQLAICFKRRSKLFRLAAYEDLRHLLKHKRKYCKEALTATERRILAKKSLPTRIWMATGKKVYYAIARGIFNFTDREGGGPRFVQDAGVIAGRLKAHPQVRDAAVVAFPKRREGAGLYAFVESTGVAEDELRDFVAQQLGRERVPEAVQVVDALPRNADGEVRNEILQLVAMNQLEPVDSLARSDEERALIGRIVAGRRNFHDRFSMRVKG